MSEYIRLLRQHVAHGRRENALSSSYRYLDRSAFWRSEHERTAAALERAHEQNVGLQLEVEALKAKVEKLKGISPTKKRKKADSDTIPVPRSPKKVRREGLQTRTLPSVIDYHDAGETGNLLLRSVFSMLAQLRSTPSIDANTITHHLLRATSAIPRITQDEIRRIIIEEPSDNDALSRTIGVGSRAVGAVLLAYAKLSQGQGAAQARGKAAHAVVKMFRDLLRDFQLLSTDEAEIGAHDHRDAPGGSSPSKPTGKAKTAKVNNIKMNSKLGLYTNLLGNVIDNLDSKLEANKDIYEGFAYCLLERLGDSLYTMTFGHRRVANLADQIPQSACTEEDDLEQRRIRLQAPYLVYLLTRLMSAAPIYLGSIKGGKSNAKSATKNSLAISARECLQRTLVDCVFGDECQVEDGAFKDCLKMPRALSAAIPIPKIKEPDVQDWFKEELWRLLGWEILAKEGEC